MTWKQYRNAVRQGGKAAARKKYGDKIESTPITIHDGQEIGWIVKFWSPIYCSWAWKATVVVDSKLYHKTKLTHEEAYIWAKCKWSVITSGRKYFAESLKVWLEITSIQDLAENIGCSRDAIYKWMNGDAYPSVEFLIRICQELSPSDWEKSYKSFSRMIDLEK